MELEANGSDLGALDPALEPCVREMGLRQHFCAGVQGKFPSSVALMDTDAQAKPVNNFNCGQNSYIFFFFWSFRALVAHGLKRPWLV